MEAHGAEILHKGYAFAVVLTKVFFVKTDGHIIYVQLLEHVFNIISSVFCMEAILEGYSQHSHPVGLGHLINDIAAVLAAAEAHHTVIGRIGFCRFFLCQFHFFAEDLVSFFCILQKFLMSFIKITVIAGTMVVKFYIRIRFRESAFFTISHFFSS